MKMIDKFNMFVEKIVDIVTRRGFTTTSALRWRACSPRGRCRRASRKSAGAAPRGACRGSPGGLRQVRRDHSARPVRRRDGDGVGHRDVRVARRNTGAGGERGQAAPDAPWRETARRMDHRAQPSRGRREELVPDQDG